MCSVDFLNGTQPSPLLVLLCHVPSPHPICSQICTRIHASSLITKSPVRMIRRIDRARADSTERFAPPRLQGLPIDRRRLTGHLPNPSAMRSVTKYVPSRTAARHCVWVTRATAQVGRPCSAPQALHGAHLNRNTASFFCPSDSSSVITRHVPLQPLDVFHRYTNFLVIGL